MTDSQRTVSDTITRDRCTELTRSLLRIPSVRAQPTDIDDYLTNLLQDIGLEVDTSLHVWPSAYSENDIVLGKLPGGDGPSMILEAHYDTMDITEAEWERDPFGGEVEDDTIYGRGAVDSKGQLAAMIAAIEAIANSDVSLSGDLYLLSCPDGEFGFESVSVLDKAGLVEDAGWMISGEATVNQETDEYEIGTRYAGLTRCEIEVSTPGGHFYPPNDTNVIHELSDVVLTLKEEVLPDSLDWLGPHFEPLSIESEAKADYPVVCTVAALLTTTPELRFDEIASKIDSYLQETLSEDYTVDVSYVPRWTPVTDAVSNESISTIQRVVADVSGETPSPGELVLLSSFANYTYSHGYCNSPEPITFGGGDHREAHSPDEKIDLADVTETAEMYSRFALELLSSTG